MTLDEAIAKYKEITNTDANCHIHCIHSCEKCAQESGQLAEWLEDYKHIKQWKSDVMDDFCRYDASSFEELVTNTRNKAIDDFVKEYKSCDNRSIQCKKFLNCADCIAEQLKVGE